MISAKYIIYIQGPFHGLTKDNSQYLPEALSKYGLVLCVERPSFKNLLNFIINNQPLLEKISNSLYIYHSINILPNLHIYSILYSLIYIYNFSKYRFLISQNNTKIITFTPDLIFLKQYLDFKNIFYYIIDDYTFYPAWKGKVRSKYFFILENKLLAICKNIIVSSISLQKKYKKRNNTIYYFSNPSDVRRYQSKLNYRHQTIPYEISQVKQPIIGFIGGIENYRIDFNLIRSISKHFINYSFVFIGPVGLSDHSTKNNLFQRINIYYLGYKSAEILPLYLKYFDVCIIPYRLNTYGKICFPIKTFEYFSIGKPVVTTALPSIEYLGKIKLLYWAKNYKDFIHGIKLALKENPDSYLRKKRVIEAKKNDWRIRIKKFITIINQKSK